MSVCYEIAIARSRSTLQLQLLSDYDYNCRLLKRKWAAGSPNYGCVFLFLFWRYLMELVERHGQQCWSVIATFLTGCIGKQCRKRGHSHLRLDIKVSTTHLQKPHRNCTRKSMSTKESYNPERDLKEWRSWASCKRLRETVFRWHTSVFTNICSGSLS
jgi:hypothetical protein